MEWGRPSSSHLVLLASLGFLLLWRHAAGEAWSLYREEERELERELKTLNKPYVKTLEEHGIIYDCVDIHKQAAFDHPLLKNHNLQLESTFIPKGIMKKSPSRRKKLPEKCPKGTVLIRRTTKEDLMRHKRRKRSIMLSSIQASEPTADTSMRAHFAGMIIRTKEQKSYGVSTNLNVFHLSNIPSTQASISEMILLKGESGPRNYINAIHAGYGVDHLNNGDNLTHFFTDWTSDGYQKTGCLNAVCKGYIQLSRSLTPGMVYESNSLSLTIYRDSKTLNWILYDGSDHVGYWPKEIFNNMADISLIQMVGAVSAPANEPTPPMGSGNFDEAKFSDIRVMNGNLQFEVPNDGVLNNELGKPYYDVFFNPPNLLSYGGPGGWKESNNHH